jgi:hypothetical protein
MKLSGFKRCFVNAAARLIPTFLAFAAGALLLWTAVPVPVVAQVIYGSMSGTVKDTQGGVIPGASVTLVSDTRGTSLEPVLTGDTGEFLMPTVTADAYTVRVELAGFKKLERSGVRVSPGSRAELGTLTLEVGGLNEMVTVTGDATPLQLASSEQSITLPTAAVQNLPLSGTNFLTMLDNYGGISGTSVISGAGDSNFQVDGVTAMEIGGARMATKFSSSAVGEVKVVQSGYDAEYGRSAGLQVNAITKSGTNDFHGSLYALERRPQWGEKSKTAILNGDPKSGDNQRDWGWTIGGPIGKPGGENKLFFFYNQEFNPRTRAGTVYRYRVPTLLERQGDFSQTLDNNGALYPYIKDPTISGTCSASNQTACFKDGGVLGKIPANRLYSLGMNILNWYPSPNIPMTAGMTYNWQNPYPATKLTGWQPVIRVDYQATPKLGVSGKFIEYQQTNIVVPGTIPGWNDTKMDNYATYMVSGTANWTASSITFVEGSFGANFHHQEGCTVPGGEPTFCIAGDGQGGVPITKYADRRQVGMANLPLLYPDANIISSDYVAYSKLKNINPQFFDGTRAYFIPSFTWGTRVASSGSANILPNMSFGGNYIHTKQPTESLNVTRLMGSHTMKAGFYGIQNHGPRINASSAFPSINFANDSNNPVDSTYGFANAALGAFSSYTQAKSFPEGNWVALNTEWFIQDSWRAKSNLTINYGLRFIAQQPAFDNRLQFANFLPERWKLSDAPILYVAGCASGITCSGTNRQAKNPLTGQLLGAGSAAAIGTKVANTGNAMNGLYFPNQGIVKTAYKFPLIALAPRVGAAWNVGGHQKYVVRGGFGVFYDRPTTNMLYGIANNPPTGTTGQVNYGYLQDFNSALTIDSPAAIHSIQYEAPLATSAQWNGGLQMETPWSTMLEVVYNAQHSWHTMGNNGYNINSVDFGAAYLPSNQDPTLSSTVPGGGAVVTNLLRPMKGYGAVGYRQGYDWRTYHSIGVTFSRRLRNNIGFYFNDTITLYNNASIAPRYQHAADGTYSLRADQEKAQELLGKYVSQRHILKANFDWTLPRIPAQQGALKAAGVLLNGWQLTGTWQGVPGTPYVVGYSYASNGSNVNITGSPDYAGRVLINGDPGLGCSDDPYRQLNTAAFSGPQSGSLGLESGAGYVRGCFQSTINLSISRNLKFEHGLGVQLRIDMFNAFNAAAITGRNATMNIANPTSASTATNLPFDSAGNLIATRSLPKNAGFGVANAYQTPRAIQAQIKFTF